MFASIRHLHSGKLRFSYNIRKTDVIYRSVRSCNNVENENYGKWHCVWSKWCSDIRSNCLFSACFVDQKRKREFNVDRYRMLKINYCIVSRSTSTSLFKDTKFWKVWNYWTVVISQLCCLKLFWIELTTIRPSGELTCSGLYWRQQCDVNKYNTPQKYWPPCYSI